LTATTSELTWVSPQPPPRWSRAGATAQAAAHAPDLEAGIFFAGAGGDAQGTAMVPGVRVKWAANHWDRALETHALNFPKADHFHCDLHAEDTPKPIAPARKITDFPLCDIKWDSPECTFWTQSRGDRRDWDKQPDLFGETLPDAAAERSRSLMWDVIAYLEMAAGKGHPVLGGIVENVVEARKGPQWDQWIKAFHNLGYKTWVIALNSMHARPERSPLAPQSRDRLYVGYVLASLGREPDWNRWLRPKAWCPVCEELINAFQSWKKPGQDMGRYRSQYVYRCPNRSCRNQIVDPGALPAAAIIDWSLQGQRIGDRARPLAPKTRARILAGLRKYAPQPITLEAAGHTFERRPGVRTWPVSWPMTTQGATETKALAWDPMLVPTGGTWREDATSVTQPSPTRTTRENDGIAIPPPFLVPLRSGRNRSMLATDPLATVVADGSNHGLAVPPFITVLRGGQDANSVEQPLTTVATSGAHHGLTIPPFVTVHRGGDGDLRTRPASEPLPGITAGGINHGLAIPPGMMMRNNGSRGDGGEHCTPLSEPARTLTTAGHQSLVTWQEILPLLVPYYTTGTARPLTEPAGTLSTVERYGLADADVIEGVVADLIDDVRFRMLEPAEIGGAMAFHTLYEVLGNRREVIRQYGNAVTPCTAEVLMAAIVEAVRGYALAA